MSQLKITPDLIVGYEQIDAEHKALCALMNRLAAAVESEEDTEVIAGHCNELQKALRKHFANEHLIMSAVGYPNADRHDRHHEEELAEVKLRMSSFNCGDLAGEDLVHYLFLHFCNHVRFEDRRLGEFIARHTKEAAAETG